MKRTSSRTGLAVASAALLTLSAAACGDDDDSADETTAPAATEAAAATTEAAPASTAAPATTAGAATTMAPASTAGGTEASAGTAAGSTGASSPAGGEVEVATADSDLGTILVDGEGRTLYLFIPDAQGGESTCFDQCADNWPPLVGEATAGEGVTAELTTTARSDGTGDQVVANGWPLYYFGGDVAAGDVNGQGLGDNWYVVSPDGEAIDTD